MKNYNILLALIVVCSHNVALAETKGEISHVDPQCGLIKDLRLLQSQTISCTESYSHYNYKTNSNSSIPSQIKIGSFNAYRAGDGQTRFKNYDIVAEMIDQWDVVGVQEFMIAPAEDRVTNDRLYDYRNLKKRNAELRVKTASGLKPVTDTFYKESFVRPGYIRLLDALQKRDSSWALLLSPTLGDGYGPWELNGFFYRSKIVSPRPLSVCGNRIACAPDFSKDALAALTVKRGPFVAGFKSGNFDFALTSYHARFRFPKTGEKQIKALMKTYKFPGDTKPISETIPTQSFENQVRLIELRFALAAAKKIESQEDDVIFAGDFNTENKTDMEREMWNWATASFLPNSRVLIGQNTSIAERDGLTSNYDHFIVSEKNTAECSLSSAKAFDFTHDTGKVFPAILNYLKTAKTSGLKEVLDYYERQVKVTPPKSNSSSKVAVISRRYPSSFIKKITKEFGERVLPDKVTPFESYLELISDHIPVEITCSTTKDLD